MGPSNPSWPRLAQTATTLPNARRLVEVHSRDGVIGPILAKLGLGENRSYLLNNEGILWHVSHKKEKYKLAIPRAKVPGVLAQAHGMLGHSGVARTTLLVVGTYSCHTLVGVHASRCFRAGSGKGKGRVANEWP